VRIAVLAFLTAAVLFGVVALIAIIAIRALRKFVRAVWPHS
jgi:hypothetical protein